eukprot:1751716-Rhodomonas_salina.1
METGELVLDFEIGTCGACGGEGKVLDDWREVSDAGCSPAPHTPDEYRASRSKRVGPYASSVLCIA